MPTKFKTYIVESKDIPNYRIWIKAKDRNEMRKIARRIVHVLKYKG